MRSSSVSLTPAEYNILLTDPFSKSQLFKNSAASNLSLVRSCSLTQLFLFIRILDHATNFKLPFFCRNSATASCLRNLWVLLLSLNYAHFFIAMTLVSKIFCISFIPEIGWHDLSCVVPWFGISLLNLLFLNIPSLWKLPPDLLCTLRCEFSCASYKPCTVSHQIPSKQLTCQKKKSSPIPKCPFANSCELAPVSSVPMTRTYRLCFPTALCAGIR